MHVSENVESIKMDLKLFTMQFREAGLLFKKTPADLLKRRDQNAALKINQNENNFR